LTEQQTPTERRALRSGVVFAALQLCALAFIAAVVLPTLGSINADPSRKAASFVQNGWLLRLGNYLLACCSPFFLFFLPGLASSIRRLGANTLATAVLVSGAAMAMIWPMGAAITDVAVDIARAGGDAATVAGLEAMAPYSLAVAAWPRIALVVAASLALQQRRGPLTRLARLGWVVAGLSAIGTATPLVPTLFAALALSTLLFDVWVIAVALAFHRNGI